MTSLFFPISYHQQHQCIIKCSSKNVKNKPEKRTGMARIKKNFKKDELLGLPFSGTSKSNGLKRESNSGESINCCVQRGKKFYQQTIKLDQLFLNLLYFFNLRHATVVAFNLAPIMARFPSLQHKQVIKLLVVTTLS